MNISPKKLPMFNGQLSFVIWGAEPSPRGRGLIYTPAAMTTRIFRGLVMAIVILALGAGIAGAQVTATISGKVEDASGAAVGGAIVAIKNLETGATRTVMTDDMGNYRALSLPVGSHDVRAEKPGFRAAVRTGINLAVGQE